MTNNTLVGWVPSGNDRGTIDILWSCCVIVILCVWVSTYPNVPSRSDRWYHTLMDKVNLMLIGFLGPDLLCGIALGQLASARRSVKQFREYPELVGDHKWTIRKAFFADMGGFILTSPDYPQGFPINAEQLFYLIQNGHVDFPKLSEEEITEKSKVDTLSKIITIWQVLWFSISEFVRVAYGYPITTMELTTMTFSCMMLVASLIWYYKPSISIPVEIQTKDNRTVQQIRDIARQTTHPDLPDKWFRTPLYFISRRRFHVEVSWAYYSELTYMIHMPFFNRQITETPWDRFPSDTFMPFDGAFDVAVPGVLLLQIPFALSFLAPWSWHFPTRAEQIIWRVCAVYHAIYTTFLSAYYVVGAHSLLFQHKWHPFKKRPERLATYISGWLGSGEDKSGEDLPLTPNGQVNRTTTRTRWNHKDLMPSRLRRMGSDFSTWLNSWRNISSDQDPDMEVRMRWIFPTWVLALIYIWCRIVFYVEDVTSLRQQTADIYNELNRFIPFLN